jgi:hypothetical protein
MNLSAPSLTTAQRQSPSDSSPVFALSETDKDSNAAAPKVETKEPEGKKKRTLGLWAMDCVIYPIVNYIGVFGISVFMTYANHRGDITDGKEGGLFTKALSAVGKFCKDRSDGTTDFFVKKGLPKESAEMARMVFWSWADGTALAPAVKFLEDRREKFAKAIDKLAGTVPDDLSIYDAEPKQTWKSVLLGRFATAAVVVPTAVLLEKKGWNDKWFGNPAQNSADAIRKNPDSKWHTYAHAPIVREPFLETDSQTGKTKQVDDLSQLIKALRFEGFYTAVCTAGLYISSRFIAKWQEKREAQKHPAPTAQESVSPPEAPESTEGKNLSADSSTPFVQAGKQATEETEKTTAEKTTSRFRHARRSTAAATTVTPRDNYLTRKPTGGFAATHQEEKNTPTAVGYNGF